MKDVLINSIRVFSFSSRNELINYVEKEKKNKKGFISSFFKVIFRKISYMRWVQA